MEFVEFKHFKNLAVYSSVLGAICAVLSVFNFIMPFFALFFIPFLGAVAPLYLLTCKDGFVSNNNKTFAMLGAACGLFLSAGYVFVFVPLVFITGLIFKSYYDYGVQFLNMFLFVLFFIMIAIVYMITNAVGGLTFGIIYNYFKGRKNEQDN